MDLEEVWRIREEDVYPRIFGPVSRGIFVLDQEVFGAFGVDDPDPRWLAYGVFEFSPTEKRTSWLYVTSGYSNPWDVAPKDFDPTGDSGEGVEFVLETDQQGDWAIVHLRRLLALEMLLAAGRIGNGSLGMYDRIPLNAPLDGIGGHLVDSVITVPSKWPEFALPSGHVMFVQFAAVTSAEREFAREHGAPKLIEKLEVLTKYPVAEPGRASVF